MKYIYIYHNLNYFLDCDNIIMKIWSNSIKNLFKILVKWFIIFWTHQMELTIIFFEFFPLICLIQIYSWIKKWTKNLWWEPTLSGQSKENQMRKLQTNLRITQLKILKGKESNLLQILNPRMQMTKIMNNAIKIK